MTPAQAALFHPADSQGISSGSSSATALLGDLAEYLSLSVLSFLTCDVGTGSTSTSQDSCEGGFGSLLTVDSLERRLAQSTQLAKGA